MCGGFIEQHRRGEGHAADRRPGGSFRNRHVENHRREKRRDRFPAPSFTAKPGRSPPGNDVTRRGALVATNALKSSDAAPRRGQRVQLLVRLPRRANPKTTEKVLGLSSVDMIDHQLLLIRQGIFIEPSASKQVRA